MSKKVKSLYRSVGASNIKFIEGLCLGGIHDGFVFSDFKKGKRE